MLSKLLDHMNFDTDFRGDQYFMRIYYEFPNQNTPNNIKELRKEVITALKLKHLVKNTTIDMTERERSLLDLLLEQASDDKIVQSSGEKA